jgi:chromate transporter
MMKNESPGATAGAPLHAGNPPTPRITLLELFLLFSQLGLSSFGGAVSAWVHRAFVVRRGLIGEAEFAAALGLARIIPGANVVNLAVMLGHRLRGAAGAFAAGLGLILGPSLVVIALTIAYRRWGGSPASRAVLEGAAAASVGLLIAMGLAAGAYLLGIGTKSRLWTWRNAGNTAVIGAVFILIGVLHFAMVPTVLLLTAVSIAIAYFFPPPRDTSHAGG